MGRLRWQLCRFSLAPKGLLVRFEETSNWPINAEIVDYHLSKKAMRTVPPVSPGEMLDEEFLRPLGLTKYCLGKDIGVPAQGIGEIVSGKRGHGRH